MNSKVGRNIPLLFMSWKEKESTVFTSIKDHIFFLVYIYRIECINFFFETINTCYNAEFDKQKVFFYPTYIKIHLAAASELIGPPFFFTFSEGLILDSIILLKLLYNVLDVLTKTLH